MKSFTYLGSKVNSDGSLHDEITNRIAKATSAFGKLRHRLWNEVGIKLDTKIQVYKAVVLTMLLYGLESWTPYRSHINQLDVFHKGCLRTICGYTLEDKISNADLLEKCKIGGIETFLIQSQLRWAGHVIRMSDERISKVLMYSQLDSGRRNVGRPWLRYKDKLKSNLSAVNIPHNTFEQVALERKEWRSMCHNGIKSFETNRINRLREARVRTKASANVPATLSRNLHSCTICGLVC